MNDAPLTTHASEPATLLADLRAQRAQRLDPARFAMLEALARRGPGQPAPVAALLRARLAEGLADYQQRWQVAAHAREASPAQGALAAGSPALQRTSARRTPPASLRCEPLAQLNAHIRAVSPGEAAGPGELASARRFRQAWSLARASDQVELAVTRRPTNAGPLNSHALVLESLALMQSLSPDYLRRFLAQVESLQWLEQAGQHYPPLQGKRRQAAQAAGKDTGKPAPQPRARPSKP